MSSMHSAEDVFRLLDQSGRLAERDRQSIKELFYEGKEEALQFWPQC